MTFEISHHSLTFYGRCKKASDGMCEKCYEEVK
jgi:Fe2+ or Zn2+ uptake regulation protein